MCIGVLYTNIVQYGGITVISFSFTLHLFLFSKTFIDLLKMADTPDKPPDINNSWSEDSILPLSSERQPILSDDLPPLETLRKMIKYETCLRLSDPVQQLFDLYHNNDDAIT